MAVACPSVSFSSSCGALIAGADLTLRLHDVDDAGSPVDAASVVARLRMPDGSVVLPDVTRVAVGEYAASVTATLAGQYWWRFEFDGDALEGAVLVGVSSVLSA